MAKDDARLHYIRTLHTLDKMYQYFFESESLEEGELEYYRYLYANSGPYKRYDNNNFLILCAVALMGINKESCEESLNHQDYEYNFKYSVPNFDFVVDQYMKGYKFPSKNRQKVYDLLKTRHNAYPFFNDARSYPTPFDMWLRVNKQNSLANFTYNYLSCVRDAFMHSEYEPLLDDDGDNYSCDNLLPIKNSDYKKFEADIFLPNFLDFVKFYYSDTAYYGLLNSIYTIGGDVKDIKHLENIEDLKSYMSTRTLGLISILNQSKDSKKIFEFSALRNKGMIYETDIDNKNVDFEEIGFPESEKEKVVKLIEKFYGDKFYELPIDTQQRLIYMITNYIFNPKMIMSSAIIALYENEVKVNRGSVRYVDLASEAYCVKSSLLLLKAYLILYRIQNESFEEINYHDVYLATIGYSESDPYNLNLYNEYKNKLANKGILEDEDTYQKMYQTEIIRDSLAHGNINLKIDDDLNEYFVFDDEYHGKHRIITISLDEFDKYLKSVAFSRGEAKVKTDLSRNKK